MKVDLQLNVLELAKLYTTIPRAQMPVSMDLQTTSFNIHSSGLQEIKSVLSIVWLHKWITKIPHFSTIVVF